MDLKSLIEARNQTFADAEKLASGEGFSAEQRIAVDAAMTKMAEQDADIARLTAIEERKATLRNPVNQPAPNPSQSNDPEERAEVRTVEQKKAFRNWMKTGAVESRALTLAADGGIVVPTGFDSNVIEASKSYGQIYSLVDVQKTDNGEPIQLVFSNDVNNGMVLLGSGATETDPSLAGGTLHVSDYTTGAVALATSLIADSGFDMDAWITNSFGQRFYRGVASAIVSGDGGNVASFETAYAAANTVSSKTAGKVAYADFVAVMTALDPDYQPNAVWIMNQSTLGVVLGLTDSNNRPLFLAGYGDGTQGFVGTILGRPVKIVTQLPGVASTNVPVYFGDLKQAYRFRQVNPGLVILRDPYTLMSQKQTAFYGFARIGGISLNAGISPVASLTIS